MTTNTRHELDELFHQPVRLELMAELCANAKGCTFLQLREKCNLTDGNLSRHLQSLAQAGAVKIKKTFVNAKPLTTVFVTIKGRDSFLKYLAVLEEVLHNATLRANAPAKKLDINNFALKPIRG